MARTFKAPETTHTRFSTVHEIAVMLRVSPMTVYRLIEGQELPAFRVGRGIRVPTAAVWKYLEGTRITPDTPVIEVAPKERALHKVEEAS